MENNLENLTIGVFAKAAGVNVETIRFYQRKGLLLEPDKPYGSIRRYGEADVTRVRFVKSAQRLGFSLDEIAELLRLEDGTHCEEASSLAEHKLKDVREKMADLARMEAVLSELCAPAMREGERFLPADRVTTGCKLGRFGYALACFIFRFLRRPQLDLGSGRMPLRAISPHRLRACNATCPVPAKYRDPIRSVGTRPSPTCLLGKKAAVRAPAVQLYQGVMYQTYRAHTRCGAAPAMVILSAKHGFVAPDDTLDPYDLRMTNARADELLARLDQSVTQVAWPRRASRVLLAGGQTYRRVMRAATGWSVRRTCRSRRFAEASAISVPSLPTFSPSKAALPLPTRSVPIRMASRCTGDTGSMRSATACFSTTAARGALR
jgi:MerR family mercuric resistance operon transcriptional regulator